MMRRAVVFVAVVAGALLLISAAAIWIERVPIADWAAARFVERHGLGPARLGIEAIGPYSVRLRSLSLCGGALTADEVTARYDPWRLGSLHLSTVVIDGLEAAVTVDDGRARIGSCVLSGQGSGGRMGIDIDAVTLSKAHVALSGTGAPAEASFSAAFRIADGAIDGRDLDAQLAMPLAGAPRHARLTAQGFAIAPQASGGLRLGLTDAGLASSDVPLEAHGITAALDWTSAAATATLAIAQFVDRQKPMRVAPVTAQVDAKLAGARLDVMLHAAAGPGKAATLDAKGVFDRNDGRGTATVALGPIVFRRGGLQPSDLVPALGHAAENVTGAVSASGSLRISGRAITPDLVIRAKELGFDAAGARVSDLSGAIRVTSLWPPATPPHQAVTASVSAAGLPPAKLHVEGQLTSTPALALETASLEVAGGTIAVEPFTVAPAAPKLDTALDVAGVDLAEITKLLDVSGLSGTGRLSGRVPLAVDQGKIIIRQGRLAAEGPGVLRYDPKTLPQEIAGAGQSVALALQALSDFHYDALTLDLDKAAGGQGTVLLHLDGRNPAVMNGQAFRFNIRIESNFDRLAEIALMNLQSVQDLLRRAAQRSEK